MAEQQQRSTIGLWLIFGALAVAGITLTQWFDAKNASDRILGEPVNNGPYQLALGVCAVAVIIGAILYRRD